MEDLERLGDRVLDGVSGKANFRRDWRGAVVVPSSPVSVLVDSMGKRTSVNEENDPSDEGGA